MASEIMRPLIATMVNPIMNALPARVTWSRLPRSTPAISTAALDRTATASTSIPAEDTAAMRPRASGPLPY